MSHFRDPLVRRVAVISAAAGSLWLALTYRSTDVLRLGSPEHPVWAIMDDAYISADFARTLASGHGPLWYPGAPHVEGFSSPLWVLLLACLHRLPGFVEDDIGRYVFGLNVVLVGLTAFVFGVAQLRFLRSTDGGTVPRAWRSGLALIFALAVSSLCSWSAFGFETTVVALPALAAFAEGLKPAAAIRTRWVGALVGVAFLARMDGLLTASSAVFLLLSKVRDRRRLLEGALVLGAVIGALFLARLSYFGEWFPNTYYLKVSGWPLFKRLPFGFFQNAVTIQILVGALGPLVLFALRRLEPDARPVLTAFAAPILQVAYSTVNGGDFAWTSFGYDRFGATAVPLLAFGLCALISRLRVERASGALVVALALQIALVPTFALGADAYDVTRPMPRDPFLDDVIYQSRILGTVTRPGARIAACSAGIPVYFAHRGGVDLLGKVDSYIAHLPATKHAPAQSRCWRGDVMPSGHNKEDIVGLFALRKPDVSFVRPPVEAEADYVSFKAVDRTFFGRRGSPFIDWSLVYDVQAL